MNYQQLFANILPSKQLITDELLRFAYATDASLYRIVPQLVLLVKTESQMIQVIKIANYHHVPITFRTAGTSLSGQALTEHVLVVLSSDSWLDYTINQSGELITLQAGVIGAHANRYLSPYQRQIGPDPASINTAKIGGIIANNSSGMCCGTSKNSYATLAHIRAIFADGYIFDSHSQTLVAQFKHDKADFIAQIEQIRQTIISNPELVKFIRQKFAIKNTSGYSLNAFLDFSDPIAIIEHLLVGSEGTLAFISQVSLTTLPIKPYRSLNLIAADLNTLMQLTMQIGHLEIEAIELLDHVSLASVAHITELNAFLAPIPADASVIMLEIASSNQFELVSKIEQLASLVAQHEIIHQTGFINQAEQQQVLWKIRKGILPNIAAKRPLGSTVIIEDIAVEIEKLADLISDLRDLLQQFAYANSAIFGHVLAGNIHFVLTPDFAQADEVAKYDQFMHQFTQLVAQKYQGSLKAEHGSGRNIAPFAQLEWGQQCWEIMWQIKYLFDPQLILNPEVKLTKDYTLHIHNLKQLPNVDPLIDVCMECGFCEPVCPSRNLSLTPRQRNAVSRHFSSLSANAQQAWQQTFQYAVIDSCATTGLCETRCPIGINTGEFVKTLQPSRSQILSHTQVIKWQKRKVAMANFTTKIIGKANLAKITSYLHKYYPRLPIYLPSLPALAPDLNLVNNDYLQQAVSVTLLPSCPSRIFASNNAIMAYPAQQLLTKLGFKVKYLAQTNSLCCGQLYHSQNNSLMVNQCATQLQQQLDLAEGYYLIDNSSCAGFAKQYQGLNLLDLNWFLCQYIPRQRLVKRYRKLALHLDCSSSKLAHAQQLIELVKQCSEIVVIPEQIYCCGFAGDKGFNLPELNASSLASLAKQISDCEIGVSFNRNCQIGLSYHGGKNYVSLVELILNCLVE
ncbi:MAG: hypothetical protein RLZZ293_692 [Pseudomonadota bacterium]